MRCQQNNSWKAVIIRKDEVSGWQTITHRPYFFLGEYSCLKLRILEYVNDQLKNKATNDFDRLFLALDEWISVTDTIQLLIIPGFELQK